MRVSFLFVALKNSKLLEFEHSQPVISLRDFSRENLPIKAQELLREILYVRMALAELIWWY